MAGRRDQRWLDYAVAICVTAVVILVREVLSVWLGRSAPFLASIVAVLIAAFQGGFRPGLLATALSAAASDFFFVPPLFSLRIEKLVHGSHLIMFVVIGVLISLLCEKRLRLIRQLREADRRKNEFLAVLGHELRNPLAPISNSIELWPLVDHDRAQMQSLRETMQRQVRQMIHLIDDLMDVSRIDHGKIELRRRPIDLATVVSNAIETHQSFIKSCGHVLSVVMPAAPVFVDGDSVRLAQVVGNVLHNAAKYTGRGGSIGVTLERRGNDAVVRVKDSGAGISPHMATRIFEMFEQVDCQSGRSCGGVGIGLALAKRLIELHGGSIEARSEGLGKGSEFIVTMPAWSGACDPRNVPTEAPAERPTLRPHHILVVDDLEESATMLAALLRAIGVDAHAVHDGAAAVEWVQEHRPDIVILDVAMPGMDGLEAAQRIRETTFHDVILIAMSGYGQDEDRRRAFEAGFDHYLTKPVSLASLRELLTSCSNKNGRLEKRAIEAE
jgi:signal transduction histidine kinase/CheY-like chemotaxis protein